MRQRARHVFLLLAAASAVLSCAHTPPAPAGALPAAGLQRLYCLDHPACTVYRSEQPTAEQFRELQRAYGIRSVVKLNSAFEAHDVLPEGMDLFDHPISALLEPEHSDLIAILNDVMHAPKPVLIHCTHGEDRTGLVVGLYRFLNGSIAWSAWREMLAYGFHTDLIGLVRAYERETGWSP